MSSQLSFVSFVVVVRILCFLALTDNFQGLQFTDYHVLLALCGHSEGAVGQFVLLGLLWLHDELDRSTPELAFYHWAQLPQLVCLVYDGNHLSLFTTHKGHEVLHFF